MRKKKIFISNLAWEKKDLDHVIEKLKKNQINGIDFAPLQITKDWRNIENKVKKHSIYLKKNKIKINAIQGVFFKKNFHLFNNQLSSNTIVKHIKIILRLCKILNCKKIIIGSTEFRKRFNLSKKEADIIFIQFLKKILPLFKKNQVYLCLETIPKQYNEKYLYSFDHTINLIRNINSKWIKINYDTSIFHFEKLDFFKLKKNINLIKNIQITEKQFGFFSKPSKKNIEFCRKIKKINMIKNISLEIISKNSNLKKLDLSIKNITKLLA